MTDNSRNDTVTSWWSMELLLRKLFRKLKKVKRDGNLVEKICQNTLS